MQQVKIVYQSKTSSDFVELKLLPEEYYDELEPDDTSFEEDGIPRFLNPIEYVPLDAAELKLVVITEPCKSGKREFRIQLLDGNKVECVHSIWPDGTEELIHTTDLDKDTYHIIRTVKDTNGYWSVVTNTITKDSSLDYIHKNYLGTFSDKQLLRFWDNYAARFAK